MIALGLVHAAFTFHDYDSFSLRALWFASAGVALVLAGFINIILLREAGKDKVVWLLCLITNIIFAVMFASALSLMMQPQVFVGVALFAAATITAFLLPRTNINY
jgi:asparagine N-glycosylation enzyme membrane subunit Stt3